MHICTSHALAMMTDVQELSITCVNVVKSRLDDAAWDRLPVLVIEPEHQNASWVDLQLVTGQSNQGYGAI